MFCIKNHKSVTRSNHHKVKYCLFKLCRRFPLTNIFKMVFGIFLFYLDLGLFPKINKYLAFTNSEKPGCLHFY